jgi:hypothetical protein
MVFNRTIHSVEDQEIYISLPSGEISSPRGLVFPRKGNIRNHSSSRRERPPQLYRYTQLHYQLPEKL